MQASSQSGAVLINKLKFGKKWWLCVAGFVSLKTLEIEGPADPPDRKLRPEVNGGKNQVMSVGR